MRQGLENNWCGVHTRMYIYIYNIYIYIYVCVCPQSIYLYINDSMRIYIYFLPVYLSNFVEEL